MQRDVYHFTLYDIKNEGLWFLLFMLWNVVLMADERLQREGLGVSTVYRSVIVVLVYPITINWTVRRGRLAPFY